MKKHFANIWNRGHKMIWCHYFVKICLITTALSHILYLIVCLVDDRTTIVTTGTFYNEKKLLKLPRFLLCFSKVLTYSKIRPIDMKQIYDMSSNMSSRPFSSAYNWKLEIDQMILGVRFNGKIVPTRSFLEPVFYKPDQRCWQTLENGFQVGRAGQISTLNLVVNVAVYDDMILNYHAPLTYLKIVPFFASETTEALVPDVRNAIYASPGRFSAIGFSWTKVDSTYRSRHDARSCTKTINSNAHCISAYYRSKISRGCRITTWNIGDPVQFYKCALQIKPEPGLCSFEHCTADVFKFDKSEAYIKFDKRLSALSLPNRTIVKVLKRQVEQGFRMHTQYDPNVRKSFQNIAQGMDVLSDEIASALIEPKGHECNSLKKLEAKLNYIKWDKLPNVIAERGYTHRLSRTFISFSLRTFKKIGQKLLKFGKMVPKFHSITPEILPSEMKNTESRWTTKDVKGSIESFGVMINSIVTAFKLLREQAIVIIENYNNLQFTKFIHRYAPSAQLKAYLAIIQSTISAVKSVKKELFEKQSLQKMPFAHQDDNIKVTYRKPAGPYYMPPSLSRMSKVSDGVFVNTSYQYDSWSKYVWQMDKGRIRYDRNGLFDVMHGHRSKELHIPIVVELFCRFYNNYLSIAERFHGTSPAYSVQLSDSRFEVFNEYVVFVLNELFSAYDTNVLLSVHLGGILKAQRRSCTRMAGYTGYTAWNTTYKDTLKKYSEILSDNAGQGNDKHKMNGLPIRTQLLIQMVANYQTSLQRYKLVSNKFQQYYNTEIAQTFGEVVAHVSKIRAAFIRFHQFSVKEQKFKRFLVYRLNTLAQLLRVTMNGDSEEKISHFLSKKGKILIGEIHLEMAEIQHKLSRQSKEHRYYWGVLRNILAYNDTSSMKFAIAQAMLNAGFHSDLLLQKRILHAMWNCNNRVWETAIIQLESNYENMVRWLRNASLLLTRAKRYTSSVQISKDFLRKNIMHVSLYYQSLTVLKETSEPQWSQKTFWTKIGTVTRVYLRINTFRFLDMVTSVVYSVFRSMLRY